MMNNINNRMILIVAIITVNRNMTNNNNNDSGHQAGPQQQALPQSRCHYAKETCMVRKHKDSGEEAELVTCISGT